VDRKFGKDCKIIENLFERHWVNWSLVHILLTHLNYLTFFLQLTSEILSTKFHFGFSDILHRSYLREESCTQNVTLETGVLSYTVDKCW